MLEYYIYDIPVFVVNDIEDGVSIPDFCSQVEDYISRPLLNNVEVVYIGDLRELAGRNAMYANGAIYMTSKEPTIFDMLENFIHETAHALEDTYGVMIYEDALVSEFKGKRERLRHLLEYEGYNINPSLYSFTEYNETFDNFLANVVGYPTLLNLTMGLFISPYGATSIQEYFANGFEKYFLESPQAVRKVSPTLYRKIEEIINDNES